MCMASPKENKNVCNKNSPLPFSLSLIRAYDVPIYKCLVVNVFFQNSLMHVQVNINISPLYTKVLYFSHCSVAFLKFMSYCIS